MGIRETLNKNPQFATVGTIVITVLALGLIVWQMMPAKSTVQMRTKAFYTIDEGKTWFVDEMPPEKLAPFTHQGKDALRAHVYQYGEKGQPFVLYMEQYTPQAKTALEQFYKDPANKGKIHPDLYEDRSRQVKKAGKPWVDMSYQIMDVILTLPEKNGETAQEIYPD